MSNTSENSAKAPIRWAWANHIGVAMFWRYLCHSLMLFVTLVNESRAAPSLPDTIINIVPYVGWIDHHNYHIWLVFYLPPALWLWRRDRAALVHFLYAGGILSLLRGFTIIMTGLGPVYFKDVNAGMEMPEIIDAWLALVNPLGALGSDAAHVYLTKDLFFSGHTSTTFLLWLYCRHYKGLGALALFGHVVVVSTVFLSHLHYTIDVIGAWAITFSVFTLVRHIKWPAPFQSD